MPRAVWHTLWSLSCAATDGSLDGASAYAQHCAACHGATAQGIDGVAPPIASFAPDAARAVVRSGRAADAPCESTDPGDTCGVDPYGIGMPAFSAERLPDPTLDALLAYLESLP